MLHNQRRAALAVALLATPLVWGGALARAETIKIAFLGSQEDENYDGSLVFKDLVESRTNGEIYVPTPEETWAFQDAAAPMKQWFVDQYGDEWLQKLEAAIEKCESALDAEYAELAG